MVDDVLFSGDTEPVSTENVKSSIVSKNGQKSSPSDK